MNPYISVIIPVYNKEQYLQDCMASVWNQTYTNMEIILIDDGSTDSSGEICNQYDKEDSRVKVFHTQNHGLVATRKKGVSCAKGEYIGFVDSDDWIVPDMYEKLVGMTQGGEADLVCCGMRTMEDGNQRERLNAAREGIYSDDALDELRKLMIFDMEQGQPGVHQSVCTKLFKKHVLEQVLSSVDDRLTYGEDAAIVYNYCLQAKKIVISNAVYYHYRVHKESMCNRQNTNFFDEILLLSEYMGTCFSMYPRELELERQLKFFLLFLIRMGIGNVFGIDCRPMYRLPYNLLGESRRIILYGAGKVGVSYFEQIAAEGLYDIIHWIDKGKAGETIKNKLIMAPDVIGNTDYDKILIALKEEKTALAVKEYLMRMGIEEEKLIWTEPGLNEQWWYIDI